MLGIPANRSNASTPRDFEFRLVFGEGGQTTQPTPILREDNNATRSNLGRRVVERGPFVGNKWTVTQIASLHNDRHSTSRDQRCRKRRWKLHKWCKRRACFSSNDIFFTRWIQQQRVHLHVNQGSGGSALILYAPLKGDVEPISRAAVAVLARDEGLHLRKVVEGARGPGRQPHRRPARSHLRDCPRGDLRHHIAHRRPRRRRPGGRRPSNRRRSLLRGPAPPRADQSRVQPLLPLLDQPALQTRSHTATLLLRAPRAFSTPLGRQPEELVALRRKHKQLQELRLADQAVPVRVHRHHHVLHLLVSDPLAQLRLQPHHHRPHLLRAQLPLLARVEHIKHPLDVPLQGLVHHQSRPHRRAELVKVDRPGPVQVHLLEEGLHLLVRALQTQAPEHKPHLILVHAPRAVHVVHVEHLLDVRQLLRRRVLPPPRRVLPHGPVKPQLLEQAPHHPRPQVDG
mmetsp:Transcript_37236/g.99102  ORF Transcript_37236/g.99102 Transcript_37236/m.99102 type:complete len:456 (-) Transcript_37236:4811-6178(-)